MWAQLWILIAVDWAPVERTEGVLFSFYQTWGIPPALQKNLKPIINRHRRGGKKLPKCSTAAVGKGKRTRNKRWRHVDT